ncbi:Uncharacterised protein [Mycobacteroides abscessus subsp. abscessus]|nr:Uncharacterised protein [Mycobacteroides abscessus subsp. abscessus]
MIVDLRSKRGQLAATSPSSCLVASEYLRDTLLRRLDRDSTNDARTTSSSSDGLPKSPINLTVDTTSKITVGTNQNSAM